MGAELEVIRERERKKKKVEEVEVESLGPNKQKKVNLFTLSFVFSQSPQFPICAFVRLAASAAQPSANWRQQEAVGRWF